MKYLLAIGTSAYAIFFAHIALAQSQYTIASLVQRIIELVINPLIMLLMVAGTAVFLWGLVEFLMSPDNEEKRTIGKRHMLWGIIGLFLMASAWGIVYVLCDFFQTCALVNIGGGGGGGPLPQSPGTGPSDVMLP